MYPQSCGETRKAAETLERTEKKKCNGLRKPGNRPEFFIEGGIEGSAHGQLESLATRMNQKLGGISQPDNIQKPQHTMWTLLAACSAWPCRGCSLSLTGDPCSTPPGPAELSAPSNPETCCRGLGTLSSSMHPTIRLLGSYTQAFFVLHRSPSPSKTKTLKKHCCSWSFILFYF